jgi:hypothetical protein
MHIQQFFESSLVLSLNQLDQCGFRCLDQSVLLLKIPVKATITSFTHTSFTHISFTHTSGGVNFVGTNVAVLVVIHPVKCAKLDLFP